MKVTALCQRVEGLVSILIPAYNHERYIQAAIDSVIQQAHQNIELIIVDDGSTDNTWNRISTMEEACRSRFVRVEIIRQGNQGVCLTLNKLVDLAQGEYVLRLDSDDLLKADSVETLHAFLSQNPDYGLAVGDNEIIDETGQRVYWTESRENTIKETDAAFKTFADYLVKDTFHAGFDSEEFGLYRTFIYHNYIPNGYLVRKKFMNDFRFSPLAPREDHFMMLQLSKVTKFKFINKVLHSYRWHSSNTIKTDGDAKNNKYYRMTLKHEISLVKDSGDEELLALLHDKLTNWRKRTKIKIGAWFEIYRVMDFFDEKKVYMMRVGTRLRPLFELVRNRDEDAGDNKWRIRKVAKPTQAENISDNARL